MILSIDDWRFDVDLAATMEYSAAEAAEHCDCAYCRNFYEAVDDAYPGLRLFLAQFGLDIEAPDELMPFDTEDGMSYDAVYAVCGKILTVGREMIACCDAYVAPEADAQIEHSCFKLCFYLTVNDLHMPWVLDEPMKDVISPANQPAFLKRMWDKFLGKQPKSKLNS